MSGYKVLRWNYATAPSNASAAAGKKQRKGDGAGAAVQAAVRYLYCKAHGANKKRKKGSATSDEVSL